MKDGCLICGAPLLYLDRDEQMECSICHRVGPSKAHCEKGHFVCDECHTQGVDAIIGACMEETSADPIMIVKRLMDMPFCHMHGPEHHVMVGAALLTAYRNAGGTIDLEPALLELQSRGRQVPGGVCGYWGACGAGISAGIFVSVLSGATPLAREPWGLSNLMTSASLERIGRVGGPRCCKRDSYLAILAAADLVKERLGVTMTPSEPVCTHYSRNEQCLGASCPFSPAAGRRMK